MQSGALKLNGVTATTLGWHDGGLPPPIAPSYQEQREILVRVSDGILSEAAAITRRGDSSGYVPSL